MTAHTQQAAQLLQAGDARHMARAVATGRVTAQALVTASLEAIAAHNPVVNAFCQVWPEQALAAAARVDRRRRDGVPLRPLEGVPVAIKDLIDMAGTVTARGSHLWDGDVTPEDAPITRRLIATGAILLGKTTTTETGWTAAGWSPLTGATVTPFDPTRTSGGSSAGSAAAIAARMVPLALGSDAGGSVRVPASFCGTFALKGHLGRIPHTPWSATEMLTCVGPMSLRVADSALAFDLLRGPDPADHLSLPAEPGRYLEACDLPPDGLRIAYAPTLCGTVVDPPVAAAVAEAVGLIAQNLPVTVTTVAPDWPDPRDMFEVLWTVGRGHALAAVTAGRRHQMDPGLARLIEARNQFSASDYVHALKARAALQAMVARLFADFDLLLLPTVPVVPFAADAPGPAERSTGRVVDWANWTPFTILFNLTQQPAASVPCGTTADGLPIGLQVVGPRFGEAVVFRLAAAIERLLPWADRLPPLLTRAQAPGPGPGLGPG